ncbi:hypothetical protein DITRI_Ditri12bG0026400 [Diplodiscus trichospermus]
MAGLFYQLIRAVVRFGDVESVSGRLWLRNVFRKGWSAVVWCLMGHYWLRNVKLAPNSFLQYKLGTLSTPFASSLIKIKPPPFSEGRFTQILSIGIGGSAIGPQFVAEALVLDNPPLKITQLGSELASTLAIVISKSGGTPETNPA